MARNSNLNVFGFCAPFLMREPTTNDVERDPSHSIFRLTAARHS